MTNLDSMFKSRDITFSTKVCLVKAVAFPVVMYGCESWTVKKAEHRTIDLSELNFVAIKGERKEEKEQDRGGRQKGGRKLSAEELMLLNCGVGEDS